MSDVLTDSFDWPIGQEIPSVGDEINYTGKEATVTVRKRVFEFNNGKLVNVKLYFDKP
jgi:hypothetical protein